MVKKITKKTSHMHSRSTLQQRSKLQNSPIYKLNEELERLYYTLLPTKKETQQRKKIIRKLSNLVKVYFTDIHVIVSGSMHYNCYLKKSNINFIIKEKNKDSSMCESINGLKISDKKINKQKEDEILNTLAEILLKEDIIVPDTINISLQTKKVF